MKTRELASREDLGTVVRASLERGLAARLGRPVRVGRPEDRFGNLWFLQPLLGACYRLDLEADGRAYLRDSIRWTEARWRRPLQSLLGSFLGTRIGLAATARPLFRLDDEDLPGEGSVVLLGNRRLRILSFKDKTSLVLAKAGYSLVGNRTEIVLRSGGTEGPFPKILAAGHDGAWFEEPLLDAVALPRAGGFVNVDASAREAAERLESWSRASAQTMSRCRYVEGLVAHLGQAAASSIGGLPLGEILRKRWLKTLADAASAVAMVELRIAHGDFQPGNIIIERQTRTPILVDWETAKVRSAKYDRLVFGLASRYGGDIGGRLRRWVETGGLKTLRPDTESDAEERKSDAALFVLEEFAWLVEEGTAGPFRTPPPGIRAWMRSLTAFGPSLEGLLV